MGRDLYTRYIWLVDTIRRYGRITRAELDDCWRRSPYSEGNSGIPRRTFVNYREAAQEMFDIEIKCDPVTYEYYIEGIDDARSRIVTDWLLNARATGEVLSGSRDVADRIFLDDVPSAREHLATVVEALRGHNIIRFDYHSYQRTAPTKDVVLEPYFLKIFRQRWYITGRHVEQNVVKTYALDRISSLNILTDTFSEPEGFDAEEYIRHSFGIIFNSDKVERIVIRTDEHQAKYLRALPLHPTQEETLHNGFSTFSYMLRITPDLVDELLSYGPRITVVEPEKLRDIIVEQLRQTLDNYSAKD